MAVNVGRILRRHKGLIMAFDQGLEHGPKQFDLQTIDPEYVFNIALEGHYSGIITTPGIAEKYYVGAYQDVPLIVKLNGKSELAHVNPVSRQLCTVDRAIKLGADAVGYTIYDGSPAESQMFAEFGTIVEQAHDYGIPVIAWMYPRGPHVHEQDADTIAYSARIGLELGADFVKLKYNNDPHGFGWAVRAAGKAHVLASDSVHKSNEDILQHVYDVMKAGATGVAFGRTIWQHPRPFSLTRALNAIIYKDKSPQEALKYFE